MQETAARPATPVDVTAEQGVTRRVDRAHHERPALPDQSPPAKSASPRKSSWRSWLRRKPRLRDAARALHRAVAPLSLAAVWRGLRGYPSFWADLWRYARMEGAERIRWRDLYPCVTDKLATTPLDLNYFLQDTWAARKVFQAAPELHVDIGSTALLVGILAQFTRVCSVDIRPLDVDLPGLEVRTGSIVALPFADQSVHSITSLCVIEHIGLGRYGDPLDPHGTDRAAAELQRVLAPAGNLYISVPIHPEGRVYFNAHRSFPPEAVVAKFPQLELVETTFIQRGAKFAQADYPRIDFQGPEVVGLYHLRRAAGGQGSRPSGNDLDRVSGI